MQEMIRIIGIDPGLRRTGWGILETLGNSLRFVASGTVTSDGDMDLASRLCQLHDGLAEVVHSYRPDEAAVEHKDGPVTRGMKGLVKHTLLKLSLDRPVLVLVPVVIWCRHAPVFRLRNMRRMR